MSNLASSSLREAGKLYLLYIAAGVAAIPAGVAYSMVVMAGWERWWTVVPLLGIGLTMALLLWRFLKRRLYRPETILVFPETVSAASAVLNIGNGLGPVAAGFAVTVMMAVIVSGETQRQIYGEDQLRAGSPELSSAASSFRAS